MSSAGPKNLVPPLSRDAPAEVVVTPVLDDEWPADGLGPVEPVMAQIPAPSTLPAKTWVAVLPGEAPPGRGLSRLLRRGEKRAHLAVRCGALLAHGYSNVCADKHGTAFAQVP